MLSTSCGTSAYVAHTIALLSFLTTVHTAPSHDIMAPAIERRAAESYSGCYSSSDPLTETGTFQYQTTSHCAGQCGTLPVMGLQNGNDCWCGSELPPASNKVDDSNCNVVCAGYGSVNCGGAKFWSVYLTGTEANVPVAGGSSSSSIGTSSSQPTTSSITSATTPTTTASEPSTTSDASTSTTQALQTIVTSITPGTTIVVTQSASGPTSTLTSTEKSSDGSPNTAGIAAGVVVGVLAVAAIIGGLYFFLRRRSQKQAEEDYKRSTQVNDFMRGGERKPPGTSHSQASDSRLDPFVGRRNSVGSMADNQDYSRRILRVANPDGT